MNIFCVFTNNFQSTNSKSENLVEEKGIKIILFNHPVEKEAIRNTLKIDYQKCFLANRQPFRNIIDESERKFPFERKNSVSALFWYTINPISIP